MSFVAPVAYILRACGELSKGGRVVQLRVGWDEFFTLIEKHPERFGIENKHTLRYRGTPVYLKILGDD
jgi:hypothetical protein